MATKMEIDSASQELNVKGSDANGKKLNRNNKCGVRVIGNRIYDSANGKTCHQVHFLASLIFRYFFFFC